MTGSKFIVGILSSGVEAELAQTIAMTAQILIDQNKVIVAEQQAYNTMALLNSNAVQTAEDAAAKVTEQQAITSWVSGGLQLTTPISMGSYRIMREGATESMATQDAEGQVTNAEKDLHNGGADLISGSNAKPLDPTNAEDAAALRKQADKALTQDVVDNLKNKSVNDYTDTDRENIKFAKLLRDERVLDADGNPTETLTSRGKLYDDLDTKYKKEQEGIQSRRIRYEQTTDRRASYIQTISQAFNNMGQGGAQWCVAKASHAQATADAVKQMTSYAETNQKSCADTVQQAFSNTAQLYDQETQMMRNLAQANAPV